MKFSNYCATLLGAFLTMLTACSTTPKDQPYSEKLATWDESLSIQSLDNDTKVGKIALKFAKKYGGFQDYYPKYLVGNLALVHGSTLTPHVTDKNGPSGDMAVILGDYPRFVRLPNDALFKHFMKIVRKNPHEMDSIYLYAIMEYLGGIPSPITKSSLEDDDSFKQLNIPAKDPLWIENNNILTFTYYSTKQVGITSPFFIQCAITFDADQNSSVNCKPIRDDE